MTDDLIERFSFDVRVMTPVFTTAWHVFILVSISLLDSVLSIFTYSLVLVASATADVGVAGFCCMLERALD